MENQEKGLTVNIGEYKGEKPIEVVYRIGNAPKALDELPIKQPESISVSGVIRTPLDWLAPGETSCNNTSPLER